MNAQFLGKWFRTFRCNSCLSSLSRREVFCTHGVCPHCGAVSDGTITGHLVEAVAPIFARDLNWFERLTGLDLRKAIGLHRKH